MAIKKIIDRNGFVSVFDTENGDYYRTGVLDLSGNDTGIDGFVSEFPQLLDIGIMGHCKHGLSGRCTEAGVECYQSGGKISQENMSAETYENLIKQCEGRTFQVALGGRGDPDEHEEFEKILYTTRKYGIVPNITTSGYGLTEEKANIIKKYCGAAAVSYYKTPYMYDSIAMLSDKGITTNLHYVLGNHNIEEAINILNGNTVIKGIDRIVFLLHKPIGMGSEQRVLKRNNPKVKEFFNLLSSSDIVERTGFDSCLVPAILDFCPEIAPESFDACESGRFSAYIDSNAVLSPCSFDKTKEIEIDLKKYLIEEAWNSKELQEFRKRFLYGCKNCEKRSLCMGGCPICPEINLCSGYEKQKREVF